MIELDAKKEELRELAKTVVFELPDEKVQDFKTILYNSDFLIVNTESEETDKKIKKIVRKSGIVKNDTDFYQLFYYFTITFKNDKSVRFLLLNTEIGKFLEIFKKFVMDNATHIAPEVVAKIQNFTFVNKNFIEDYRVFAYKMNMVKILNKFDICSPMYKSYTLSKSTEEISFDVLKSEVYEKLKVNNSKVNVLSNYLYFMKDLEIIKGFN